MKKVNVYEAKTKLSQLLALVEQGETVVIARNGTPVATLTAHVAEGNDRLPAWFGALKGKISVPEDFDEPDPDIMEMFYGNPDKFAN